MNIIPHSLIVYRNLYDGLFKYRHVEPVTKQLSDDEFFTQMNQNRYLFIVTKVIDEYKKEKYNYLHIKPIYIILLSELNENATRSSILTNLIEKVKKIGKDKDPEIIIIANKKKTTALNEILRKKNVYMFHYVKFAIIFPECTQTDEHRIMEPDEVTELLERLRANSKKKFNKILKDDTMVIWIGAKVDDFIEIKRISETTVYSYEYRLVKNKTLNYD